MADSNLSITKRIWIPFWILTALTILEFTIAFTVDKGAFRNWVFIIMTIAKAYYIVAFFMHLKFEKTTLIYSIVIPTVFIIYAIVLFLIEGGYIDKVLNG